MDTNWIVYVLFFPEDLEEGIFSLMMYYNFEMKNKSPTTVHSAAKGKTLWGLVATIFGSNNAIECFHMTSRRPCWCPKPVHYDLNSFLMQTLSFVPITLYRCWPREWKHSIARKSLDKFYLNVTFFIYSLKLVSSLQQFSSFLMFFLRLANTYFRYQLHSFPTSTSRKVFVNWSIIK